MKTFEKMYNKIISEANEANEVSTADNSEEMKKHGLNETWVKYLQDNGFKKDGKSAFRKTIEPVILEVNIHKCEINFYWVNGKHFHTIKDIAPNSDPVETINSATTKLYEFLINNPDVLKSVPDVVKSFIVKNLGK